MVAARKRKEILEQMTHKVRAENESIYMEKIEEEIKNQEMTRNKLFELQEKEETLRKNLKRALKAKQSVLKTYRFPKSLNSTFSSQSCISHSPSRHLFVHTPNSMENIFDEPLLNFIEYEAFELIEIENE